MEIKTLATGSSGNCYVLTADTGARLIIECGIPWRRIAESMRFNFSRVCGCLISHEHKDHSLAFKDLIGHGIKICASEGTFRELNPRRSNRHEYVLKERSWTTIGDFQVLPLAAVHDAAEPMMFVIRDGVDVLFLRPTLSTFRTRLRALPKSLSRPITVWKSSTEIILKMATLDPEGEESLILISRLRP